MNAREKSVNAREKFTPIQKRLMLLSSETLQGIRITGTYGDLKLLFNRTRFMLYVEGDNALAFLFCSTFFCGIGGVSVHCSWCGAGSEQ